MNDGNGVAFARLKRLPLRLRVKHLAALLRSGRLGVFKHEEGQEAHFLGVIKPGEPAGEMALIAGTPHTATVGSGTNDFTFDIKVKK